ncbi:hypothetical protein GCM10028805_62350 [Spirosoma harenae]
MGATVFFVVSGFLIWKSYASTHNFSSYFEKRARRILPAYLAFVFIAIISLAFVSRLSLHDYFTSKQLYTYVFANLTFLNFIQPCLPGVFDENWQCAVNGALWTIKVEIMFYFFVALFYTIINRVSRKYILLIAVYFFQYFTKHTSKV